MIRSLSLSESSKKCKGRKTRSNGLSNVRNQLCCLALSAVDEQANGVNTQKHGRTALFILLRSLSEGEIASVYVLLAAFFQSSLYWVRQFGRGRSLLPHASLTFMGLKILSYSIEGGTVRCSYEIH